MARATNDALSELHETLARHMLRALDTSDQAKKLLEQYPELPDGVREFLRVRGSDNPALFTAVTKFLKDNNITTVIDDSKEMSELEARLKAKKKISVGNIIPMEEYV